MNRPEGIESQLRPRQLAPSHFVVPMVAYVSIKKNGNKGCVCTISRFSINYMPVVSENQSTSFIDFDDLPLYEG